MRRKIRLYIGENLADLNDQGLVLFNYALTDLENPTAVKNSFSKQITLPGTPTNDAIFGFIGRTDRVSTTGFTPGKRTGFTILDELGEVLERGYLRLDTIVRRGCMVTAYKVTLFGGLGEFFYALSYDENGDKRTLASLDYLGGGSEELDFKINATNVLAAWDRITGWNGEVAPSSIWDVINFAPAYNGCPDGNFSADKAIVKATDVGLSASKTVDGVTYQAQGDGSVLVNLAKPHTEWEVKDLRSYLQRPVLHMNAFMWAIRNPDNNGGFDVEVDSDFLTDLRRLYKTLPMLPSLSSIREEEGNYHFDTLTRTVTTGVNTYIVGPSITEEVDTSTTIKATVSLGIYLRFSSLTTGQTVYPSAYHREGSAGGSRTNYYRDAVIFTQLLAISNGAVVGGSTIHCYTPGGNSVCGASSPSALAELCGFSPQKAAEFETAFASLNRDGMTVVTRSVAPTGNFVGIGGDTYEVEAAGVTSYRLAVSCYLLQWHQSFTQGSHGGGQWRTPQLESCSAYGMKGALMSSNSLTSSTQNYVADGGWLTAGGHSWYTLTYKTASEVRSGALISKGSLLSSKYTPAEYLISLVKILGGVFRYDKAAKKVYIMTRNAFYNTDQETIDLSGRIDRAKDITVTPITAKSKWYEFLLEQAAGTFSEEYKAIYGVEPGIMRVNTGYEFDAAAEDMLKGSAYRQAATVLEHGPYYCSIFVSTAYRPPVFIDNGNTYTLWSTVDGKNMEFDIQRPPSSASIVYLNEYGHEGYDNEFAWKLQLHDKEDKPVDGEDILVYYSGMDMYDDFKVSDDSAVMASVNGGTMCWDLNKGAGVRVADFHRYDTDTEWGVNRCLDFGIPREVDIPWVNFFDGCSRYELGWAAYLRDLLNKDTKTMKCRVNLEGLQVGPELFRRFFWYENSLWVLNKITNYSLTTYDTAECEFIQVRNKNNYTNGQTW